MSHRPRNRKPDDSARVEETRSAHVYRPPTDPFVLDAFFRDHRYFATRHHIDSFDDFLARRLRAIVRSMNPFTMVRNDPQTKVPYAVHVYIGGHDVLRPDHSVHVGGATTLPPPGPEQAATPNAARRSMRTYGVPLSADVHVTFARDGKVLESRNFERVSIGFLPLVVHSSACALRGLGDGALRAIGECPFDMGGYFIVDGREKVMITQEDRVANRLYMRHGELSEIDDLRLKAFIRCVSTDVRDVFPRTTVFRVSTADEITMTITHISGKPVPLAVVFRALGVESDRDIMRVIFRRDVFDSTTEADNDEIAFMRPTLIAGHSAGFSHAAALAYLVPRTRFGTALDLKNVLLDDLFPNVPRTLEAKALMLGTLVRRLIRGALGKEPLSDLDDYTNKRLVTTGALIADIFRDAFLQMGSMCLRVLNAEFATGPWRVSGDVRTLVNESNLKVLIQPHIVTQALIRALKGASIDDDANSPVQELTRTSYLGYLSHMRRVNNPVDRSVKIAAPHRLRGSHWGILCPVESPDGPNVGLLTHLATLVEISLAPEEAQVDKDLRPILAAWTRPVSLAAVVKGGTETDVYLDDTWVGTTDRPAELTNALRSLRQAPSSATTVWRTLGVTWDAWRNMVSVRTSHGRCCRPLLRVVVAEDSGRRAVMTRQKPSSSWSDLISSGVVELIDVEEMVTCLVAMSEADLLHSPLNRYTHVEIHAAAAMLSLVTNTYPLLHHNSGAYNSLCLAQFKQAIGLTMTSQKDRYDTLALSLHYGQRPVVGTSFADRLFGGALAHGENLVVAIATYTGFNQEDAVILNLDAVHRGRLSLTVYETYRVKEDEEETDGKGRALKVFANPGRLLLRGYSVNSAHRHRLSPEAFAHLDDRGLPLVGTELDDGAVLAGMVQVRTEDNTFVDSSERLVLAGSQKERIVDGVVLNDDSDANSDPKGRMRATRSCMIRLRQVRSPELGDKVSSRFGQKGVVGMLLPAVDMPFCEADGIVPDLIINPNGFPRRMTVAHLIESVLGRNAVEAGTRVNADTFGGDTIDGGIGARVQTRNGRGGERAQVDTSVGINYYGRLKHMVADKIQQRATGAVDAVTRQPAKHRGRSGGLRIGEMEQNAILAHGMGGFLRESFVHRSDRGTSIVDAVSGKPGGWWVPHEDPEAPRDECTVETPYTFQLVQHELNAMNISTLLRCSSRDIDDDEKNVGKEPYADSPSLTP